MVIILYHLEFDFHVDFPFFAIAFPTLIFSTEHLNGKVEQIIFNALCTK